jgi:hypothetical protein
VQRHRRHAEPPLLPPMLTVTMPLLPTVTLALVQALPPASACP